MADTWQITIQGTSGMHSRGSANDADRIAKQFAETLRSAGHPVDVAEFCVVEPEGDPLRLLDGVPTVAEWTLERATASAAAVVERPAPPAAANAANETPAAEVELSGGPRPTDTAAATEA